MHTSLVQSENLQTGPSKHKKFQRVEIFLTEECKFSQSMLLCKMQTDELLDMMVSVYMKQVKILENCRWSAMLQSTYSLLSEELGKKTTSELLNEGLLNPPTQNRNIEEKPEISCTNEGKFQNVEKREMEMMNPPTQKRKTEEEQEISCTKEGKFHTVEKQETEMMNPPTQKRKTEEEQEISCTKKVKLDNAEKRETDIAPKREIVDEDIFDLNGLYQNLKKVKRSIGEH